MMSNFNAVNVLIPGWLNTTYTYQACSNDLSVGDLVKVPFRTKDKWGVVWSYNHAPTVIQCKIVQSIGIKRFINDEMRTFIEKVSLYYMAPIGAILKMMMSGINVEIFSSESSCYANSIPSSLSLTSEQEEIVNQFTTGICLIDGVTGSGKTYVYLELARQKLLAGKSVLILVPEIALIIPLMNRCIELGFSPIAWHSSLSTKKRNMHYFFIYNGSARLIIGTRSALFLPIPNLELIIVDEEHDSGYKQEDGVCYHARDMAIWRGVLNYSSVVLSSATPSLETCSNVARNRYQYYQLKERYGDSQVPHICIVDLKKNPPKYGRFIGSFLEGALADTLKKKEQSLLFINKRGYAPLILCRTCGHRMMCPACSVGLVGHMTTSLLKCHYCQYQTPWSKQCPVCYTDTLKACGPPGAERILEEINMLFPDARVHLATSDVLSTPNKITKFITQVENREIDIIVGTQMIAKGYHFAYLTFVGIIDMDTIFFGPDFRSLEKGYQLITQVTGRAGREMLNGRVMLQTWQADQTIFHSLDNRLFLMNIDAQSRWNGSWPPFLHLVRLIISHRDCHIAYRQAQHIVKLLRETCATISTFHTKNRKISNSQNMRNTPYDFLLQFGIGKNLMMVLGPSEASIFLLRKKYRYQILLKGSMVHIRYIMRNISKKFPDVRIDVDPISCL